MSWTDANVDAVPDGMATLVLSMSKSPFVRIVVDAVDSRDSAAARKGKTVATKFCAAMTRLRQTLKMADSGFIRCIKPTPRMIPGEIDSTTFCAQLRALGMLAACEVLRVGLPTRVRYHDILEKLPESARLLLAEESKQTMVTCVLTAFDMPVDCYRLGKTRVFFPASSLSVIQNMLAFDAAADPARVAKIEQRLKEAKESANEARSCATQARAAISMAEVAARQAYDSLTDFQKHRDDCEDALFKRLSSAAGSQLASNLARRRAEEAAGFEIQAATLRSVHDADADQLRARLARAVRDASHAADDAAVRHARIEPVAKASDAASIKAWEKVSTLGSAKSGLLQQIVFAADDAANAAARLRLDDARKALVRATSLTREAQKHAATVSSLIEEARHGEKALAKEVGALDAAEEAATRACETASKIFDALCALDAATANGEESRKIETSTFTTDEPLKQPPVLNEGNEHDGSPMTFAGAGLPPSATGIVLSESMQVCKSNIEGAVDSTASLHDPLSGDKCTSGDSKNSLRDSPNHVTPSGWNLALPCRDRTLAGWEALWDDNYGLYYYFNTATGETQWEPPTLPARASTRMGADHLKARENAAPGEVIVSKQSKMHQRSDSCDVVSPHEGSDALPPPEDHRAAYDASDMTALATEKREGYLMKQGKWTSRWKPRWFVLEDSYLEYFDKKAHAHARTVDKAGGKRGKEKVMQLEATSITSFTDTENCFCVTTGSTSWFLVAPDERAMAKWIAAINAHIISLRQEASEAAARSALADNGTTLIAGVHEFVRVVPLVPFVEVRTGAALNAPTTGQRLRPGDVCEVRNRVEVCGVTFICLSNFGWADWLADTSQQMNFEPAPGTWSLPDGCNVDKPAKYRLRRGTLPVQLLRGPSHQAQVLGEAAICGKLYDIIAQFVHPADAACNDDREATFIQLGNSRGWAPLQDRVTKKILFEKCDKDPHQGTSVRRLSRFF